MRRRFRRSDRDRSRTGLDCRHVAVCIDRDNVHAVRDLVAQRADGTAHFDLLRRVAIGHRDGCCAQRLRRLGKHREGDLKVKIIVVRTGDRNLNRSGRIDLAAVIDKLEAQLAVCNLHTVGCKDIVTASHASRAERPTGGRIQHIVEVKLTGCAILGRSIRRLCA